MLGHLPELDAGLIGREGDVDGDGQVRTQGERAGARAGEGRLLLSHGEGDHVARGAPRLGHQPRGLGGHEAADPVVERTSDQAVIGHLDRVGGDHADVADPHHLTGLVAVLGPDVEVQVLQCRRLLPVGALHQVNRLTADDPRDHAVAGGQPDALADQHDLVPAADLTEAQEAVVVDVGDVDADLVDVTDDGQRRAAGGPGHAGQGGADVVSADLGGEGGAALAPGQGRGRLVA